MTLPLTDEPHAEAPPSNPSPESDPRIGTVVAERYRILAPIAEGGMGRVYRGEHVTLRRRVAVKFLHAELSRVPEIVARFEREALAAAALEHTNVVAVTDFGRTDDGLFFLVMEYIEGCALREVIEREGRLPLERALAIARQVAAALARAHACGIVHRDLKPENIMLVEREGESNVVKVLDFGIAKIPPASIGPNAAALTQAGLIYGTPEYMAPEQALGGEVTAAADIYALGVVLFELLVGRRPFIAGDVVAQLALQVSEEPPRASLILPGIVTPAVDDVLMRILARSPGDRYRTVHEAIDALEAAASARPASRLALTPALDAGLRATTRVYHRAQRLASRWLSTHPLPRMLLSRGAALAQTAWTLARGAALHEWARTRSDPRRARRWAAGLLVVGLGSVIAVLALAPAPRRPVPGSARATPRARPPPRGSSPARAHPAPEQPSSPPSAALSEHRLAAYLALPQVTNLLGHARRGDADAVIAAFRRRYQENPEPEVAYVVGMLAVEAHRYDEAMRYYDLALRDDPGLAGNTTLLRGVVRGYCQRRAARGSEALLAGPLAHFATPLLADAALQGGAGECRARAERMLRSSAFAAHIDAETLALLDLRAATRCEGRRRQVEYLARAGTARSLPVLEGITLGRCVDPQASACNACLEELLPRALAQIRARTIASP